MRACQCQSRLTSERGTSRDAYGTRLNRQRCVHAVGSSHPYDTTDVLRLAPVDLFPVRTHIDIQASVQPVVIVASVERVVARLA